MKPLTDANIEAELSYAYLHAVASSARVGCEVTGRTWDNAGVDARLVGWGPFAGGYLSEVEINVQLKATIRSPVEKGDALSYRFAKLAQYDHLRCDTVSTPRILVVLYLPPHKHAWTTHTSDALSLHRCAYWVSLRGAVPSDNDASQTVYLPKNQRFDAEGLMRLMSSIARDEIPLYERGEYADG